MTLCKCLLNDHSMCLQEVVQGKSLGQMVSSGQRASEDEVQRIATDLLSTLKYLSGKC